MMVILSDNQRQALQYVQAANSGGYRPTATEVDEWLLRPNPLPGKKGKLLSRAERGEPPIWARELASANALVATQFLNSLQPTFMNFNRQILGSGLFDTWPSCPLCARWTPRGLLGFANPLVLASARRPERPQHNALEPGLTALRRRR